MKKFPLIASILMFLSLVATTAVALDPVAPRSFRKFGMIYVESPNPQSDSITLIRKKTGFKEPLQSGVLKVVPVGKYRVEVKMQSYHYQQDVWVESTERTDVIVPGYGNLKVNAPNPSAVMVEVYPKGKGKLVAKFPATEIKTLPRGHYEVRIKVGSFILTQPDVWVVTNTTRILDVITRS